VIEPISISPGISFLIVPYKRITFRKYPYFKRTSERQAKRFNVREARRAAKKN